MFINNKISAEKIYVPTSDLKDIRKKAKKGDKDSIDWLRALGKKI